MVDFRYHLVSTVAVFLALAVGIVVGTTALNGPVLDDLQDRVAGLSEDNRALEGQLQAVRQRSDAQEQAALALTPEVVPGRLSGQRVVLVSGPDAPAALREQLLPLLTAAGATVGPSVRLRPGLFDAGNAQLVDDLVAQVAVPGAELPEGEPVDQAVAQLAQVLVQRPGVEPPTAQTLSRVLGAYQGEDLVDVEGELDEPGTLAVLLVGTVDGQAGRSAGPTAPTPGTVDPADAEDAADAADTRVRALLGLARALDVGSSGAVVAGSLATADDGGVVAALRDDNGVADRVSSVDAADTPTGRLAVVLALQEQRAGGAGAYGSGSGAEAPLPDPS